MVTESSNITKKAAPFYTNLSSLYARLAQFLADPGPHNIETNETVIGSPSKHSSRFKKKKATLQLSKAALYIVSMNNSGLTDMHIELAEDKQTAAEKAGPIKYGHLDKNSAKKHHLSEGMGRRVIVSDSRQKSVGTTAAADHQEGKVSHQDVDVGVPGPRQTDHDRL